MSSSRTSCFDACIKPKPKRTRRKALTVYARPAHNCSTTTINGNTAPRKHCGFFMPGFRRRGPLTHSAGTGTRQFLRIGAWSTPGAKADNRTNNRGRLIAVVDAMRLPFLGGASIEIRLGATAIMQHHTQLGELRPPPAFPPLSGEAVGQIQDVARRKGWPLSVLATSKAADRAITGRTAEASRQRNAGGGGDGKR